MKYKPDKHHRRSIRLKNYDYSRAGLYFITICTQARLCLFGEIIDHKISLNDAGEMVKTVWHEIPAYYEGFEIHEFVVMPNHIHGIIQIVSFPNAESNPKTVGVGPRAYPSPHAYINIRGEGQARGPAPTMSIPDIVHRYKTLTTKRYIDGVKNNGWPRFNKKIWQQNYYEHIIRNEESYLKISEYIINNPSHWQTDKYYIEMQ